MDEPITVNRGAEITGYTQALIRRLAGEGRIKAKKFGRDWQISLTSLLAYKRQMQTLGPAKYTPYRLRKAKESARQESIPVQTLLP